MLKDVEWAKDGTYIPGEEFSPERFFNDGLKNSCSFRPATRLFQFCHY